MPFSYPNESIVITISKKNKEPKWMLDIRLKALKLYKDYGGTLAFDPAKIIYVNREKKSQKWEDVPKEIRDMYDKLNISDREKEVFLGGMAQINAMEMMSPVYSKYLNTLRKKGVIFEDLSGAIVNHPNLIKKYFGSLMDWSDPISLMNTAVWTGGSILYVPRGIKLTLPLQMFYFINMSNTGQFERTLIILEDNSTAHFVEGCTAPMYSNGSVHIGVGEMFVGKDAYLKLSSIQNWSKNMSVIARKKALVNNGGKIQWVEANLGAGIVDKHPTVILKDDASAEILSVSEVTKGQTMDTGGRVVHDGKNSKSHIVSKAVCYDGGSDTFNGMIYTKKGAKGSIGHMECDTIMVGQGHVESHPSLKLDENDVSIGHEATAGKINDEILFYMATRGFAKEAAIRLIVSGFVDDIIRQLPFDLVIGVRKILNMDFVRKGTG